MAHNNSVNVGSNGIYPPPLSLHPFTSERARAQVLPTARSTHNTLTGVVNLFSAGQTPWQGSAAPPWGPWRHLTAVTRTTRRLPFCCARPAVAPPSHWFISILLLFPLFVLVLSHSHSLGARKCLSFRRRGWKRGLAFREYQRTRALAIHNVNFARGF